CNDPNAANNFPPLVVMLQFVLFTYFPTSSLLKNRSMLFSSFSGYPGTGSWMRFNRFPSFVAGSKPDGKQAVKASRMYFVVVLLAVVVVVLSPSSCGVLDSCSSGRRTKMSSSTIVPRVS